MGNLNFIVTSPVSLFTSIVWFSMSIPFPVAILNKPERNCMPLFMTVSSSLVWTVCFASLPMRTFSGSSCCSVSSPEKSISQSGALRCCWKSFRLSTRGRIESEKRMASYSIKSLSSFDEVGDLAPFHRLSVVSLQSPIFRPHPVLSKPLTFYLSTLQPSPFALCPLPL